ncbi:MAG: hypothetical protein AAF218_06775 [Pseudomonadota bacterium]
MTKTTDPALMTGSPAPMPRVDAHCDTPMTEKTAAVLRELCAKQGEPFDTALTEAQAQERIAALKEAG